MNFGQIQPLTKPEGFGPPAFSETPLDANAIAPSADDEAAPQQTGDAPLGFGSVLEAMNAGGAALARAEGAENAFIAGTGGLQEMVFERAKADTIVSVAAAATSRVAQSLNALSQIQL